MNKTNFLFTIILFSALIACQQAATNTEASTTATDTVATTPTQETPKTPSKSESIDTENDKLITEAGEEITKAVISTKKGIILLYADEAKAHRIFGYEMPDVKSKRLFVVSTFTNDVDGNPHGCELGAYYDMETIDLKYLETAGDFVKAEASSNGTTKVVYLESKWVTKE